MNAWVIAVWVIAAVMGCWSFSLLVRTISELLARKRVHLTARRSIRSLMLGGCLSLVCGVVSLASGIAAIYLERQFTASGNRWTTPLMVIGASVCLFALLLLIWAIIGDRSRGRKRCPKCWYDMSASPSLQCPECGKSAKNERKLSKARRPRWAFVLAVLMVVPSIYAMMVSKRVAEYGAFAAVPTWFLMAGWEHLPDGWIYDNGAGSLEYCLENRLNTDWVSDSRLHKIGRGLTQPLLESREARWDERRMSLIATLSFEITTQFNEEQGKYISTAPPIDPETLLLLSAEDILDAIQGTSISPENTESVLSYPIRTSPYDLASGWIFERIHEEHERNDENENLFDLVRDHAHEERLRILSPIQSRFFDERIGRAAVSSDPLVSNIMLSFSHDAEIIPIHLDLVLSSENEPGLISWQRRAMRVGVLSTEFNAEHRAQLFRRLIDLLRSENTNDKALACKVLFASSLISEIDDQSEDSLYQDAIRQVIMQCVGDQSTFTHDSSQEEESVHSLAIRLLVQHDTSGELIFPLLREQLMLTGDAPESHRDLRTGKGHTSRRNTKLWLNTFGSLAYSPDPEIREWIGINIPHRVCTPADAELNLLALGLAMDHVESVADAGRYALEKRDAMHLIPDADD